MTPLFEYDTRKTHLDIVAVSRLNAVLRTHGGSLTFGRQSLSVAQLEEADVLVAALHLSAVAAEELLGERDADEEKNEQKETKTWRRHSSFGVNLLSSSLSCCFLLPSRVFCDGLRIPASFIQATQSRKQHKFPGQYQSSSPGPWRLRPSVFNPRISRVLWTEDRLTVFAKKPTRI